MTRPNFVAFAPVLLVGLALLVHAGCKSLYTGTVTLTGVVDSAAKEYAKLYNDGLVPPDVAVRASNAHAAYRKAASVAHDALVAVKLGQTADTKSAIEAARQAAGTFIDTIVSLLTKDRTAQFRAQLQKANGP